MWCVLIWNEYLLFDIWYMLFVCLFVYDVCFCLWNVIDLNNVETQLQVFWSSKSIRKVDSQCIVFNGRESIYGASL